MSTKRIRRCIKDGRFEFTIHSLEELDDDNLTSADARHILLTGEMVAELTNDPRGSRFVVRGRIKRSFEEVVVEVVCRLLPSGRLRVITVYIAEE